MTPSPDGVALAAGVREVLEREGVAAAVRDASGTTGTGADRARLELLAGLGVPGLLAAEPVGLGLSLLDAALVAEELGRAVLPEAVLTAAVFVELLSHHDDPRTAELAAGLGRGALVVAGGLGDPLSLEGRPGSFTVSGRVTAPEPLSPDLLAVPVAGPRASGIALVAPAGGVTTLVDGSDTTRPLVGHDLRAAPVVAVVGHGARAERALRVSRLLGAAELVGLASATLDTTVRYVREREQFGRPIGSFQAVKHQLADAWAGVEAARAAVRYAASVEGAQDPAAATWIAGATATAVETATDVTARCVHLHGGMGYAWETGLHLAVRRAHASRRALGPMRALRATVVAGLAAGAA